MEWDEGADLADRVTEYAVKDLEYMSKLVEEHAKATIKAVVASMGR